MCNIIIQFFFSEKYRKYRYDIPISTKVTKYDNVCIGKFDYYGSPPGFFLDIWVIIQIMALFVYLKHLFFYLLTKIDHRQPYILRLYKWKNENAINIYICIYSYIIV